MIILRNKNPQSKCYLLVGLPGSGKSTWCKKNHPDLPIVSRDIIRYKLGYTSGPDEKARLSRSQEELVTKEEYKLINNYLDLGIDFIIDDTNLRKKYRVQMIETLKKKGAYVVGVNFNTPLNVCIERRKEQISPNIMTKLSLDMDKLDENEVDEIINVK
jgi:predicted kinase